MTDINTTARVLDIPDCDICDTKRPAAYDARTKQGPWAFLCEEHFQQHGVGLGLGNGQRLIKVWQWHLYRGHLVTYIVGVPTYEEAGGDHFTGTREEVKAELQRRNAEEEPGYSWSVADRK